MKIGALASLTGVSIRMLRYYEQEGLLKPPRTAGGYRVYGAGEVQMVQAIVLLNEAGLTLAAIKDVLACAPAVSTDSAPLCDALKAKVRQQVAVLEHRMAALNGSRQLLLGLLQ